MKNNSKLTFLIGFILFTQIVFSQYSNVKKKASTPKVVYFSPTFNEISYSNKPEITVTFNVSIDSSSINSTSFLVFGERTGYHSGIIKYVDETKTASFISNNRFNAGEKVQVTLTAKILSQLKDSLNGFSWQFRIPSKKVGLNFSEPISYSGGGYSMQCCDMNNDGSPDIITSSGTILINNGNGQFNSFWTLPDADGFGDIIVDDFNRDGIMDVIYTGTDGIKIGLGDGTGNFIISTKPFWLARYKSADLNNDGYPDIIGGSISDTLTYLNLALNTGSGKFIDTVQVGVINGWFTDLLATDIDNDGYLDLVVSSQHALAGNIAGFEGIIILRNNGGAAFSKPEFYQPYAVNFAFPEHLIDADFNNDGYTDIAVMGDMAGYVCLNLKNGRIGTDTSSVKSFWGAEQLSPFNCGDINGDGWMDIAKSGFTIPFELSRFFAVVQNCSQVFSNCSSLYADSLPEALIHAVAAVDIDLDGDMDLVHAGEGVFITINKDTITSVGDNFQQPNDFILHQNYPNPFNSETVISFHLFKKQRTIITIYNILGKEVKKLKDEVISAGDYSLTWNGTNDYGITQPSGIYLIKFQTNTVQKTVKSVLLK